MPFIYNTILFSFILTLFFYFFGNVLGWSWGFSLFNGYTIVDRYSTYLKISILFTTIIIFWNSKKYLDNNPRHLMEFPILMALACLLLLLLVSSYNFMTMFLSIVGFSLNVYVLLLYDSINHASREAGVKYYYLSTFSSGLLLSGVFFIYMVFHTTNFLQIIWTLHVWTLNNVVENHKVILGITLYFLIFGFFFKLAAFPCHMWAPEVYEGSPHPITAFFILPIKIATFGFFLRMLTYVFSDLYNIWSYIIWFSSIFSMLWGCFGALVEKNFKKFIAFSSINQMGFLLMGLACGTFEGVRSSLIYLLIYVIMNLGLFIIFLNARETNTQRPISYLTDFSYFAKTNWLYSAIIVTILFSMAGVPPLAGFFGKYYLFLHAFEVKLYSLVIVGMISSLISSYYYLRIVKTMWFENQPNEIPVEYSLKMDKITQYFLFIFEIFLIQFLGWNNIIFSVFNKITLTCMFVLTGQ